MPEAPTENPPILLTVDYSAGAIDDKTTLPEHISVREQQLRMVAVRQGVDEAFAVGGPYRDTIVQARLALLEGGEGDLYGLFLRQAARDLYYRCAVSPGGHAVIGLYAGQHYDVRSGQLPPDFPFASGLGQPNLFQVVACGPNLTFILNDRVVGGVIVDVRCAEGSLGFYLHHGSRAGAAVLAADWLQARAVFPESQEHEGGPS